MIDEKTLFEFRKWAVAYGGYSEVTAKKDVRNIRRISRDIDVMNISEKMLYDFVDLELKRGKGPGAINSEMRSMIAWKKFRGLEKNSILIEISSEYIGVINERTKAINKKNYTISMGQEVLK